MNIHAPLFQAALLAAVALAFAPARAADADAAPGTPPEGIVIDCGKPVRPSQKAIGELAGQHDFGQVYATRQRTMGEVRRSCRREGVATVLLVPRKQPVVTTQAPRQIADTRSPAK